MVEDTDNPVWVPGLVEREAREPVPVGAPPGDWLVRRVCGIAAIVLVLATALVLLVSAAIWLVHHDTGSARGPLQLLGLGAGLFAAGALLFIAQNFAVSRRTLKLTKQRQVIDRYTKAIAQLSSDKLDVRIGSIYALERVARDSARHRPPVMEVLAAFSGEYSRKPLRPPDPGGLEQEPPARPDVQAALTVVMRRTQERNVRPIDLAGANLTRVRLLCARLFCARLAGANLARVRLLCARLFCARLAGANLARVRLLCARLFCARLAGANLARVRLLCARLFCARLTSATRMPTAAFALAAGLVVIVGGTAGLLLTRHSTPALRPVAAGVAALPAPIGPIVAPPQSADPRPIARPVLLTIPLIGVSTQLVTLGMTSSGALQVPSSTSVAGWYMGSAKPGAIGSAIIEGHVNSVSGPGVFFRLSELRAGDVVYVKRSDGTLVEFRVTSVQMYLKDRFPTEAVYRPTPDAELRLITCGGAFDSATGHYLSNTVVYAKEAS